MLTKATIAKKLEILIFFIKDFYEFNFCSNTIVSMCLETMALMSSVQPKISWVKMV